MTKSLLGGMALCAVLAFAGNAVAYQTTGIQTTAAAQSLSSPTDQSTPSRDCVHVLFPQCDRGN